MTSLKPRSKSPRIRVLPGGHLLIALTILFGLIAAHSGQNVLEALVALLLAFQAVSGLRSSASVRGVGVSLELPRAVTAGAEGSAEVVITNRKRRFAATSLEIEAVLEPLEGARARMAGPRLAFGRALVGRVEPGRSVRVRIPMRGLARGVARVAELRVSSAYPCDLFRRTLRFPLAPDDGEVLVRPAHKTARPPARRGVAERLASRRALVSAGRERGDACGVRPWRDGEPLRSIHWRASARVGSLVAREEESESSGRWAVVLAPDARAAAPAADAQTLEANATAVRLVEDAVEDAAALLRAGVAQGKPVALCAAGFLQPIRVRSGRGLESALDALARWTPSPSPAPAPPARARVFLVGGSAIPSAARAGAVERAPFPWIEPASPPPEPPIVETPPPIAGRARIDLAVWAIFSGVLAGAAVQSAVDVAPQVAAAVAALAIGRRSEAWSPSMLARLVVLVACAAFAAFLGGSGPVVLIRFFSALAAGVLLRRRTPGEHGFLLALFAAETAVAAAMSTHALAAPAAVLSAVLAHRAVGSWHRLRAADRALRGARPASPFFGVSAGSAARAARAAVGPLHGVVCAVDDESALSRAGHRAALACVLFSVPLFLALPRSDMALIDLPSEATLSEPGVGDEVRLGRMGSVGDTDEVVGRAKPANDAAVGADPYFRVATYENFDGSRWTSTLGERIVKGYDEAEPDFVLPGRVDDDPKGARWELVIDAGAGVRLPLPDRAARVAFGDPRPKEVHNDDAVCLRPSRGRSVARWSYVATVGRSSARPLNDVCGAHTARLPRDLDQELAPAVRTVVEGIERPTARAAALVAWVRGQARYSTDVRLGGHNPVGDFLFRARAGHCELFAAALASALRVVGIPSRVVGGYHASRWNELGGFWVLRRRDAHAWVEAYLEGSGWTRLDATPASALVADPYAGALGMLARVRDALVFSWNRHVLGFDQSIQAEALSRLREPFRDACASGARLVAAGAHWAGVLAVVAGVAWIGRGRRSRRSMLNTSNGNNVSTSMIPFYTQTLRSLDGFGIRRRGADAPQEFLRRASRTLDFEANSAVFELTRAFERVRYGFAGAPSRSDVSGWLATLAGAALRRPRTQK